MLSFDIRPPQASQPGVLALAALLACLGCSDDSGPTPTPLECIDYGAFAHILSSADVLAFGIALLGDRAVVASGAEGVGIVDVSDPESPGVVARVSTPSSVRAVAASPDFAYAAGGDSLFVVSLAGAPAVVASLDIGDGEARGMALAGGRLYLADLLGLVVFDLANPVAPVVAGSIALAGGAAVVVDGPLAYVAGDGLGLAVVDVSEPSAPAVLGRLARERALGVAVAGRLAYLAEDRDGLEVIGIADPVSPVAAGRLRLGRAMGVVADGARAYVLLDVGIGGSSTLALVDASNAAAPRLAGRLEMPSGTPGGAVLARDLLHVANQLGLTIVDVRDGAVPAPLGRVATPQDALGVAADGGYLYAAVRQSGLRVFDLANGVSPVEVGAVDTPGDAVDVAVDRGIAYVADTIGGLQIVDVAVPTAPVIIGSIDTPVSDFAVAVSGTRVCVAGNGGLAVVDAANPAAPALRGRVVRGNTFDVAAVGEEVYLAAGTDGLLIVDASDPAAPVVVSRVSIADGAFGVAVEGERVFVGTGAGGLVVVDATAPASPVVLGAVRTDLREVIAVALDGDFAYAASLSGLLVADVSRGNPRLVGIAPASESRDVAVAGSQVYLGGGGGIDIFAVQCAP